MTAADIGKIFVVSDNDLVLHLEVMPEGEPWRYGVTSPFEPQLITEANSVEEAFAMARDAIEGLRICREKYAERISELAEADAVPA